MLIFNQICTAFHNCSNHKRTVLWILLIYTECYFTLTYPLVRHRHDILTTAMTLRSEIKIHDFMISIFNVNILFVFLRYNFSLWNSLLNLAKDAELFSFLFLYESFLIQVCFFSIVGWVTHTFHIIVFYRKKYHFNLHLNMFRCSK